MFKSKLPNAGNSIFSEMSALANQHQAINLSQGFPDFQLNPRLAEAVKTALNNNDVQYAPMPGRMDLRLAIAQKMLKRHKVDIDPVEEVTITAGATQAIYTTFATLIQAGDEVIILDPSYDCYDPGVRVHGGIPIHVNLTFPNYTIDWDVLRKRITDKTKMLIVNNPHNPTGSVLTIKDIHEMEALMDDFPNLYILSDEVYEHIQYDGEHQSVLKSEKLRKRSFVVYSFGKSMHVTGWKLGYCIAPSAYMKEFRKIHQYMVFCANNTMQSAVANFLLEEDWKNVQEMFQRKKDIFLKAIASSRFKPLPCEGTYFCLLDYHAISTIRDVEFAKQLTEEYGVAVIPVSVFYEDQTDNHVIRVCFAKEDETLTNAAKLLCKI